MLLCISGKEGLEWSLGRKPGDHGGASSLPALGAHRWFALGVLSRLGSETGFQSSVLQPFDAFPSERWSAVLCVSQLSYLPGLLGQTCWGIASLPFRGEAISASVLPPLSIT